MVAPSRQRLNRFFSMNFFKKFPILLATALFVLLVITLAIWGVISAPVAGFLVLCFQLALIARDKQRPACLFPALSQEQIEEFESILEGVKSYDSMFKELAKLHLASPIGERILALEKSNDALSGKLRGVRRGLFRGIGGNVRTIGNQDFIGDDAAEALFADCILQISSEKNGLESIIRDGGTRERVLSKARSLAGLSHTKTALDGTTTPLPTIYVPLVIELVWKYGQARQYATVYPLGAGPVTLPRLPAGEEDVGYLWIGPAGMAHAGAEKRVTAELVTFTANKLGGLIRIPTEIEEDTFIPLGQFLARYIARQLAKLEDKTMFLGDGTATYADITGIGPYCVANPTYLQQLAATKTKPTDATISDFRAIRGLVNPAVLVDDPAYYINPTMEALLVTFNTIGSPLIYRPAVGAQPATLDGFPIHWTGILQPYSTAAAASSFLAMFGALQYWYLGERGAPRIEVSREVFFATDEIAMRALERIDVEAMAIDAMSALQTAVA